MIKKLRKKFILLAMTALFVLLALIVTGMNIINYYSVVNEADQILSVISQNQGMFPNYGDMMWNRLPPAMSPEAPFESRYFSVVLDKNGNIIVTDTSKVFSVDATKAIAYAQVVLNSKNDKGFVDDYRYVVYREPEQTRIAFLDCGRKLEAFRSFLYVSSGMSLAGLVIMFLFIFIFSGKIIRPVAESYEKQKRFITDAGHEIKTPLTIINANADILEIELGEKNESLADIQQQTRRLRSLTEDLVMLARMEETELPKITFPISDVIAETAHPFSNLAISQGKQFLCEIQHMLTLRGNERNMEQLISILLDNALKYSPASGTIALTFCKEGRNLKLTVFNTTDTAIDSSQINQVFDRFYRTDSSRNSETGGHGIGLSVAKAIVTAHNGKISAQVPNENSFQVTVLLPA